MARLDGYLLLSGHYIYEVDLEMEGNNALQIKMLKSTLLLLLLFGCFQHDAPKGNLPEPGKTASASKDDPIMPKREMYRLPHCCLDAHLDSIQIDSGFFLLPIEHRIVDGDLVALRKQRSVRWHGPKISMWLEGADTARTQAYAVEGLRGDYFVVLAPIVTATGLAANFTKWLVLKQNNRVVADFWNLLDTTAAIYKRVDAAYFEVLSIDFNTEFSGYVDFENNSFDLAIYTSKGKRVEVENGKNNHCDCLNE